MSRWTCPRCDREFGRTNQGHTCVPGCTLDECFAPWPAARREVYEALMAHVRTLGPVHLDIVRVGVFLKHETKFAEVRPKARSLSLAFVLPRAVAGPRVARTTWGSADRVWHVVKLLAVPDVDEQVRDWLTEAYHAAG